MNIKDLIKKDKTHKVKTKSVSLSLYFGIPGAGKSTFAAYLAKKEEAKAALESKMKVWEKEIQEYVNSKVNKFSKISQVELRTEAFEKTATQKIKRYLYA